jgi:rhodanese-related sulfurtransferase
MAVYVKGSTMKNSILVFSLLFGLPTYAVETPVILDVRTPAEFSQGHAKNAMNIDFRTSDFAAKITKLDKSKSYVVHCAVGGRSALAYAQMKQMGFKNVEDIHSIEAAIARFGK